MRYQVISLARSETETIEFAVAPWEVPVLQLVHGSDRVGVTDRFEDVGREVPESKAEYDRMDAKYKRDAETGQRYVAAVYGLDLTQLEAAMVEAVAAEAAAAEPAAKTGAATKSSKPTASVL